MKNRNNPELNFGKTKPESGKCLDPQPPKYLDCIEDYKSPGYFGFFDGNSMEGHYCACSVEAVGLNLKPKFDIDKQLWVWAYK